MIKEYSENSVLVLVHPDPYALKRSSIIDDPTRFSALLAAEVSRLIRMKVQVMVLSFGKDDDLPDFLEPFRASIIVIPNHQGDEEQAQAKRVHLALEKMRFIDKVFFSGGWKNACLKHTINHFLSFWFTDPLR